MGKLAAKGNFYKIYKLCARWWYMRRGGARGGAARREKMAPSRGSGGATRGASEAARILQGGGEGGYMRAPSLSLRAADVEPLGDDAVDDPAAARDRRAQALVLRGHLREHALA